MLHMLLVCTNSYLKPFLRYKHLILYTYHPGDHWGDPEIDGRIILRWILRKWEGVVRTGWIWLRIGTGGGHL